MITTDWILLLCCIPMAVYEGWAVKRNMRAAITLRSRVFAEVLAFYPYAAGVVPAHIFGFPGVRVPVSDATTIGYLIAGAAVIMIANGLIRTFSGATAAWLSPVYLIFGLVAGNFLWGPG